MIIPGRHGIAGCPCSSPPARCHHHNRMNQNLQGVGLKDQEWLTQTDGRATFWIVIRGEFLATKLHIPPEYKGYRLFFSIKTHPVQISPTRTFSGTYSIFSVHSTRCMHPKISFQSHPGSDLPLYGGVYGPISRHILCPVSSLHRDDPVRQELLGASTQSLRA
jgi:hypothetical protein